MQEKVTTGKWKSVQKEQKIAHSPTDEWIDFFKTSSLFKSLNEEQKRAVSLPIFEHGLIIAGAGTGKTKTLVTRLCALLHSNLVESNKIVALTFTSKAAEEMKIRLKANFYGENNVFLGTFHSFALKLIFQDLNGFGFEKHPEILSENASKSIVKKLVLSSQNKKFERKDISDIYSRIATLKDIGYLPEQIKEDKTLQKEFNLNAAFISLFESYQKELQKNGKIDFSDMLLLLRNRLLSDLEYRDKIQKEFQLYCVDEFQDTNPIQYEILFLLLPKNGSIFAVGDDAQSIYAFRGARVEHIFDFKDNYAKENVVKLEQNYRSSKNIVNASNSLINKANKSIEKNLWTENLQGKSIYLYQANNEKEEARQVVLDIKQKIKLGVSPSQIAVLFRQNSQSVHLELGLRLEKINFAVSGNISLFEFYEIKLLIDCIKVIIDPYKNESSFINVIKKFNLLPISSEILSSWEKEAVQENTTLADIVVNKRGVFRAQTERLIKLINEGQKNFDFYSLERALSLFLMNIGYYEHLKDKFLNENLSIYQKKFKKISKSEDLQKQEQYKQAIEYIKMFFEYLRDYQEKGGKYLENFLAIIETQKKSKLKTEECVNLMTVHASKGLEFDYVYIIGAEDNIFPSFKITHKSNEDDFVQKVFELLYKKTRANKNKQVSEELHSDVNQSDFDNTLSFLLEENNEKDKQLSFDDEFLDSLSDNQSMLIDELEHLDSQLNKPETSGDLSKKTNDEKENKNVFAKNKTMLWSKKMIKKQQEQNLKESVKRIQSQTGWIDVFKAHFDNESKDISTIQKNRQKEIFFQSIEEERRLMYVALTRAKKELQISFCQNRNWHFERRSFPPCHFLADIPEEFVTPLNFPIEKIRRAGKFNIYQIIKTI